MKMHKELKDFLRPYWYAYNRSIIPLRKLLVKPLTFLPVSSIALGPPKGFYQTTKDWIDRFEGDTSYIEVHPSQKICRNEPLTLEHQNIHWKFRKSLNHESPSTFVAEVPTGRVLGENGYVITPDDRLLADVSIEHRRTIQEHSLFTQWRLPPVDRINGTGAVLSTQGTDVYFHWMFDVLPRLELIRRSGRNINDIDKFIFSSVGKPFQVETLATLGIPQAKIITNRTESHIQAEMLILPSWTGTPGQMPSWVCDFLRKSFLVNGSDHNGERSPRIYISRAHATHRRIRNETEVMEVLDRFGFQPVTLESLTVAEQALLFSTAEAVVAPHGAGLSNLVFCNPGTKVIEFFSPNYVEIHYWALSNQVGLDYYYLIGEGKNPPESRDPHWIWDDILINIDFLSEIIKMTGIK